MSFLLDTNACIALINGRPASVRVRFNSALASGNQILVSSIVAFELWYGIAKSPRKQLNQQLLEAFFAGPIQLMPFDDQDARTAGSIRATLELAGKPIGAYDVLIAGQALRHKLTLVTANVSEFSRVKSLNWQDWAKPQ